METNVCAQSVSAVDMSLVTRQRVECSVLVHFPPSRQTPSRYRKDRVGKGKRRVDEGVSQKNAGLA